MTIGDYLTAEARNKLLILAIVLGLLMVIRLVPGGAPDNDVLATTKIGDNPRYDHRRLSHLGNHKRVFAYPHRDRPRHAPVSRTACVHRDGLALSLLPSPQ